MSPDRTCPDCGAPTPADAPRGLCPRCLLGAARSRPANGSASRPVSNAALRPAGSGPYPTGTLAALAETVGPIPRVLLRDTEPESGPDPLIQPDSPEVSAIADRSAHLQLFGEIARGGMGAVLKGRDVDLGRDLAVKVLLEKHRDNIDLIRRFVEEAQIAGQLQHPGVVPVYELGAFADLRPYFAMKLVKGRTLAQLLAERPEPAAGRMGLLSTVLQVGQTIAYAHSRGVIHRDLKPSNVMVGGFGEVQVMDWGLAKVLARGGVRDDERAGREEDAETVIATARSGSDSDLSRAGSIMGTPSYMAPEQARGEVEAVDERADVFALGSILCEVLTGQPAFTGRSSAEIQRKAARGDLAEAVARLDACGADADLVGLARDCLAPERDDRPRDASAFAERLGGYLASIERRLRDAELRRAAEAARAEEAQARVAVERSRRRRTVALAASLLALLTLGGLASAYALQQHQARLAAADRDLEGAEALRRRARERAEDPAGWQAALAALERIDAQTLPAAARARSAALGRDIQAGAAAARADQDLLARVLDIRSLGAESADSDVRVNPSEFRDSSIPDGAYARAFRAAGYDVDALGPERAGAAIRGRPESVALALAAALDDWAAQRRRARPKDEAAWRRLVAAARVADPDPRRAELRALWERDDRGAQLAPLREMARVADVGAWPAPTLILLARALAEAGDPAAAVALLRRAVVRHAGDVAINYLLARLIQEIDPMHPEGGIPFLTAARALRPETGHALAHAVQSRDGGWESEEAIAIFRDLNRLQPEESRHLVCLARALGMAGRFDEARAAHDSAILTARAAVRRNPADAKAHCDLAEALKVSTSAYMSRGRGLPSRLSVPPDGAQARRAEAIKELREAVRLQPDLAIAHYELGDALSRNDSGGVGVGVDRTGRREEAIAALRQATRLQPSHALSHFGLGLLLRLQGRYDESVAAYREFARCDPQFFGAHGHLAEALIFAGEFDEATRESREAARLAPQAYRADTLYDLARLLLRQGKVEDAVAAFREALRLEPRLPAARTGTNSSTDYAIAYRKSAGTAPDPTSEKTIAAYRAATRLRPEDPEPCVILGQALEYLGKLDEAAAAFREAIARRPDFALARVNLARVLQARGKTDEAVAETREVLRLDPDDVRSRLNLSNFLRARGDYAEALQELRKVQEQMPREKETPTGYTEWLVRETETMAALAGHLPAMLAGEDRPKGNDERIPLAKMCSQARRYAAATRFRREAMEEDPKLADDLGAAYRYYAAVDAARAGCGQGKDDPAPDDAARARLRRQALAWLRADLALRAKQKESDPAADLRILSVWKSEAGLAGVRDPEALDKLPEVEQAEWRALWAEVDRLLQNSGKVP